MTASGIITMAVVLAGTWGGFAYFLYRTLTEDAEDAEDEEQRGDA